MITNGYEVALTTARGRNTSCKVEFLTTGDERHVDIYPDGQKGNEKGENR